MATMKRSDSTTVPSGDSMRTGPSIMIGPAVTILTVRIDSSLVFRAPTAGLSG